MNDEALRSYVLGEEPSGAGRRLMLLVNPFSRVAGWQALGWGVLVVAASVAVAVTGHIHFDGVMDLHVYAATAPAWLYAFEPVADWVTVAVLFWLAGAIFSRSKQRSVDYFGTTALARLPYLIAGILWTPMLLGRVIPPMNELTGSPEEIAKYVLAMPGLAWLIIGSLLTLVLIVWLAVMNYFALKESSGMKHATAIPVFIVAALVAEVVSKAVIAAAAHYAGVL